MSSVDPELNARKPWSQTFPRLHELYLLDPSNPKSYFNHPNLSKVLLRDPPDPSLLVVEQDLQELDEKAWRDFKLKNSRYISVKDNNGWHTQFFDSLNEAKAYRYLKDQGCADIEFLVERDRPGKQTPDLCGTHQTGVFLVEVKTIHESDDGNDYLLSRGAYETEKCALAAQYSLNEAMKQKLQITVNKAFRQLDAGEIYATREISRRVVFLIIWLDFQCVTRATINDLSNYLSEICPSQYEIVHRIPNRIFVDRY